MDLLKVIHQVKPDIVVLATGDADFVPLMQEVRRAGVRVEVAAFVETAGADMQLKCSGFINLATYYHGYLAGKLDEPDKESREEQYQDLIQSQERDLHEQAQKFPDEDHLLHEQAQKFPDEDHLDDETSAPVAENTDELNV